MRRGLIAVAAAGLLGLAPSPAAARLNYSTAPFHISTHAYAFGQAPVFMPGGRVLLFGKDFQQGAGNQVYSAAMTGSGLRCLTCTGPGSATDNVNGVPAVRPQGDWVIFHSWRGHRLTIGSPGYGGMGSALWAMRADGSQQAQLTEVAPAGSAPGAGEGYDDYHAYWSPDGRRIVWAHLNWDFVTGGGSGRWDVRVADFVVRDGRPALTNVRVVRPANGHWYETQWWAPDGSGFLYTETWGTAVNPELFYCRLPRSGPCRVTRLTDNSAWDEQALFTPDMKDVIFMSSRAQPGLFNTWSSTAQTLGLSTGADYLLILPLFEAGFLQPFAQETTDLYELDLRTRAVRRLTTDGDEGWITPEFTWDPSNRYLLWTENKLGPGYRYPLPPDLGSYARSLATLLTHPANPIRDTNSNGVGVAPVPVAQRTRIGAFGSHSVPAGR